MRQNDVPVAAPKIDAKEAIEALRAWWRYKYTARDVGRRAVVRAPELYLAPYWRIKYQLAGTIFGYDEWSDGPKVNRDTGAKTEAVIGIAAYRGDELIAGPINDLGGELIGQYEGHAKTLYQSLGRDDAVRQAADHARARAIGGLKIQYVTDDSLRFVPEDVSLLYYPLWLIKYQYAGRSYFATIDAVTGRVLAGRAPSSRLRRAGWGATGIATIAFALFLAYLFFSGSSPLDICAPVPDFNCLEPLECMGIIVLMLIAVAAFTYFARLTEITVGNTAGGYKMDSRKEILEVDYQEQAREHVKRKRPGL